MEIIKYRKNNAVFLKVKDYYNIPAHVEKEYDDGLYHTLNKGPVKDIYCKGRSCTDWLEWAFNNPNQPTAEYDMERDIFLPFLDGSRANTTKNLGSLKTIWFDFARINGLADITLDELDINKIESDFWNYYISTNSTKFNRSVEILRKYVRERRCSMSKKQRGEERSRVPFFSDNEIWMEGCYDYLKHLVYTTPRGYVMEIALLRVLREYLNVETEFSEAQDERLGIDGYVIINLERIPISLKPISYKHGIGSPLYEGCWVVYHNKNYTFPDLVFEFKTGAELLFED